jgi:hypothetical protein
MAGLALVLRAFHQFENLQPSNQSPPGLAWKAVLVLALFAGSFRMIWSTTFLVFGVAMVAFFMVRKDVMRVERLLESAIRAEPNP